MPLTPLHVLYFDAEIQKTDTYQSGRRLPEGFFAKNESHDRSCAFLKGGSIASLSRFPFGPFNQMRRAHMQQKIIFKSKGLNCSGLFFLPHNYSATHDAKL